MTPRFPKRFAAKAALPPRVPAPATAQMRPAPATAAAPSAYRPQPSSPVVPAAPRRALPVAQAKRLSPSPAAVAAAGVIQRSIWQFHGDRWVMLARTDGGAPAWPLPRHAQVGDYFDDATGRFGNRYERATGIVSHANEEKGAREGKGGEVLGVVRVGAGGALGGLSAPPLPPLPSSMPPPLPPLPASLIASLPPSSALPPSPARHLGAAAAASAAAADVKVPARECQLCYEPILDSEPAVAAHCAANVFHRTCFDRLRPDQRSAYLFKVLVRGRPITCTGCHTHVDPNLWLDALGAAEVARLQRTAAPVAVDEKRPALDGAPLGVFACPSCGAPFSWGSGCDYLAQHNEAGQMIRFHVIDNTFGPAKGPCASRHGHSHLLSGLIEDIRRIRDRDPNSAYRALLALKARHREAWAALGLDARLGRIDAQIARRSMQGALDEIGLILAPAFQALADILSNYIRACFPAPAKDGCCIVS